MESTIIIAVVSALTSGGFLAFVQFLIARKDRKQERAEDKETSSIKEKLTTLEKDVLRTQMLIMILLQPDEQTEILKIAEHYFVTLKGNWYMTGLFSKWCDAHGLEPDWFKKN